jgi:hypothetical protein
MQRLRKAQHDLELDAGAAIALVVTMSRFALAVDQHRAARTSERRGYPMTAAFQWRKVASLMNDGDFAERCWCEWERLMYLPRRFSAPI